ncbi:MAG: hypothetical protein AAFP76_00920 [Bacteroidota bacterium]
MKKLLLLVLITTIITSCRNDDDNSTSNGVNIRLENVSLSTYSDIIVNTSTGDVSFENLVPGQRSAYTSFDLAYRYAYISLQANGEAYVFQPIDYVGETPLTAGNYTYRVGIDGVTEVTIELVEE